MQNTALRTLLPNSISIAAAIVLTSFQLTAQECALYPIALSAQSVSNAASNAVLDIFNGGPAGGFGWLAWGGSPSEPALVASLTPPGNSATYVNPDDTHDHQVVSGRLGVEQARGIQQQAGAGRPGRAQKPGHRRAGLESDAGRGGNMPSIKCPRLPGFDS